MPDENHLQDLNADVQQLRDSLTELRKLVAENATSEPALPAAIESANKKLRSITTQLRLFQTDAASLRQRLEQAERATWDLRVRWAETAARLKNQNLSLEQIQHSTAWKAIKPFWKLLNRSNQQDPAKPSDDLQFSLELPERWETDRELLLIKGYCFSRTGRQLAGIRAKIGRKGRLARYGLERPDLIQFFAQFPLARYSGFTIEVSVPVGTSVIRLEAIEHRSDWELFFEHELEGKRTTTDQGDNPTSDHPAGKQNEKPIRLPPLSADKTFARLEERFRQHAGQSEPNDKPFFSVITPVFNTKPQWLGEAALSLLNQSFSNWEWCIVDDGSQDPQTKKLLTHLSNAGLRIRVTFAAKAGISPATNQALDLARGDYVCFLDHDDLLDRQALALFAEKMQDGYEVAYSDEDKLDDATGKLVEPFFKPDWSPEYFRGVMYVGHLLCLRRDLASKVRFDSDFDGIQDFEFMLRVSETGARIGHIPEILYHWRKTEGSIAARPDAKPQIDVTQERAVNAHLARLGLPAHAESSNHPHRLRIVPTRRSKSPPVSIIIPTKDAPELLERCLKSISEKTSYPAFEVILIDNNTTNARALQLMAQYPTRRIEFPDPFNFARANNQGAAAARGHSLLFLNNDTEILTKDWLQQLTYYAEQPDVGGAGALLVYQDRTVQHAGVVLGMRGTADHIMRGFAMNGDGYAGSLTCAREVSAITAACFMIRKSLFEEIGGFNPHFFTAYQDVDLCLRLRERGFRLICTPEAIAVHHESVSRKRYYDVIDRMLLLDRWETLIDRGDPYYNPNLNLERGDYSQTRA